MSDPLIRYILGETKPLRFQVTGDAAFTLTSATVTVYGPDKAQVDTGTLQILTPGTASQELRREFTPTVAGRHKAIFTVVTATGETYEFPVAFYVQGEP